MSIYSKKPYINSASKGKSFNFSEWDNLTSYNNNSYVQDFVVYDHALYACINSVPEGMSNPRIDTADGNITGKYWVQIIKGIVGPKGEKGNNGLNGADGKTYVPHISSTGTLTWSENGNPPSAVNIKGPKGDPGNGLEFAWKGSTLMVRQIGSTNWTPSPDLMYNKIYTPEVKNGNLVFTLKDKGLAPSEINITTIKGENGKDGKNGVDGKDGKPGRDGRDGQNGAPGKDGRDGKNGLNGLNGKNGKSAYQLACEKGFTGTENQWLTSLQGRDGNNIILRVDNDTAQFPDENYCGTHIQWKYDSEDYTEWRNLIQINQLMNLALGGINLEYEGIVYHGGVKCQHLVLNYYEIDYIDADGKIVFGDKIRKVSDVYIPVVRMSWDDDDDYVPDVQYFTVNVVCVKPLSGATVKLNGETTNEITVQKGSEVSIEVSAPCYETVNKTIIVNEDICQEIELKQE